jgi:hypothetical protein
MVVFRLYVYYFFCLFPKDSFIDEIKAFGLKNTFSVYNIKKIGMNNKMQKKKMR